MSRARFCGAMLGLATGDALGTTLEFKPPGTFAPIDDIFGGALYEPYGRLDRPLQLRTRR
jgi:ADP-ribosylglycohydrolase